MNVADSQRIATSFEKKGYQEAKNIRGADLVIINSCLVRESAENRVYGLINKIRKSKINHQVKIILTGCLAGWALKDKSGKNLKTLIRKTENLAKIIQIEDLANFRTKPKTEIFSGPAYVPISNGCNHFCSYCIVPYGRGKEVHRPVEPIIKDVNCVLKKGFNQIMLLGQSVNSWRGKGTIKAFPQLLKKVAQIEGVEKLSWMSANPWDFSDQIIKVIAEHDNIPKEIHLPVQSGDDQILTRMNRHYTAKQYLALIKKIKKLIPQATFTTDLIVGFPGETEEAFNNTVNLCQKVGFKLAFINKYSPRPGTLAAKLYPDDIDPQTKKRRWQILEKLINQG